MIGKTATGGHFRPILACGTVPSHCSAITAPAEFQQPRNLTMMRFAAALLLAIAFAAPALAGKCEDDVKQIEAALASKEISSDERAQLEDMKNQAKQLCAAGNVQEGLDVSAEAKSMLDLD
jgi:hypothetical protein